jgi:hypothetical protein
MNENIVQWVLLRKTDFLAKHLRLRLRRKLAEYQTTDFGVIDFAFDTADNDVAVVELETAISNRAKLEFCLEQSIRYKNLASQIPNPLKVFILYDQLGTPLPLAEELRAESAKHGLELRTYSMLDVKELYQKCMEELELTSGIYLGRPVAMNVTHLRLMNRLLMPFWQRGVDRIPESELGAGFSQQGSRTVFRVRRTIAEHFDLIKVAEDPKGARQACLTDLGKRFCANMTYEPLARGHEFDLSHGQCRVLLEALTNGRFTKSKVNIYYLLRFIHITNGEWIPKEHGKIGQARLTYLNNFLGTDYTSGSLTRLVRFTFNQCVELGLVEGIQTAAYEPTFKAFLTSLGSRVLGFLELYLHLKREQIQIPLHT